MIEILKDRVYFFGPLVCFLLVTISLIFLYPDGRSFFIINGMYSDTTDVFFKYATHIGDGLTAIILFLVLSVFYKMGPAIWGLLGLGTVGIISYLMKYHLFANSPRPHHFFWGNKMIHYTNDVSTLIENSFPSGHTFTAFFTFTFLAFLTLARSISIQIILALLTIIAGYSRVYLAQHFIGDVVTGAILGILLAFVFAKIHLNTRKNKFFRKSLIGLLKK